VTCLDDGPFGTEAEARAAALALGGPPRPGWSILSPPQRLRMLTAVCETAGVELGAYDARFLEWLSGWEDGFGGVFAGIVTRAASAGKQPPGRGRPVHRYLSGKGSGPAVPEDGTGGLPAAQVTSALAAPDPEEDSDG
jgi:hypothetical protein